MAWATTVDGQRLYYEVSGAGQAMLLIHEFGGDHRSWRPQVSELSSRYTCITYAARGFPPSDVPPHVSSYSQDLAVADAWSVLDAVGAEGCTVVGNSMGAFTALLMALRHPGRISAAVIAGCGYGAQPQERERFQSEARQLARRIAAEGSASVAQWYGRGPTRLQLLAKNPDAFTEHLQILAEHDDVGAANTMRGIQAERPTPYDMVADVRTCEVPILIIAGDEDDGVLEPSVWLKRNLPGAGLVVLPRSGHLANLEEPELFNGHVLRFLDDVDAGRWEPRVLTEGPHSIMGLDANQLRGAHQQTGRRT